MARKQRAATIHGEGQDVVFAKENKTKGKIIGMTHSERYTLIVVELDKEREIANQHTNRKSGRKI